MILLLFRFSIFLFPFAFTEARQEGVSSAELARVAEEAFDEGLRRRLAGQRSREQFRAAVAAYEQLHRRGANNALLFSNLGNARMLAGDLPGAILAYRLGLRIAPGNHFLQKNLAEARSRVAFREGSLLGRPPEEDQLAWLPMPGNGWLFALTLLLYGSVCAAFTRWWMLRRRSMVLAGCALMPLVVGMGVLLYRLDRTGAARPIVVIDADGVQLRKGNGRLFPPRYETPLNRGVEAQLLYSSDDWLQIELAGGEVGWVAASEAVVAP
jgi:hypothetical protein